MAKKKSYRTDKKSDASRKAKPSGYRYSVGHDKDHPLYYKRPTAEEIRKHLAGEKLKTKIYWEGRVERADQNQTKKLEKGGAIENNYEGKSPKEIWDAWNNGQRLHFLTDHTERKQHTPASQEELSKKAYKFLPKDFKKELDKHIKSGQYEKGGGIGNWFKNKFKKKNKNFRVKYVIGKNYSTLKTEEFETLEQAKNAYDNILKTNSGVSLEKFVGKDKPNSKDVFDGWETISYDKGIGEFKDGGEVTGKTKTILGVKHNILRKSVDYSDMEKIESSHPLGTIYTDGEYGYVEDTDGCLRFDISDLEDIKEKMDNKKESGSGLYVAVHESKDGYWTIASTPTTKDKAELMLGGAPEGEVGKVVTLEEAKSYRKVIGADYLEREVKEEGGTVTLDTHGKAVTIIDAKNMSTEDIVKKEIKEMGRIQKSFLRQLLGRDLNYHETIGTIKLRKPHMCSYFVEIK